MELLNPLLMGILLGGLYAVVALGLSLIFGVAKEINLAHGDLIVFGSYFVYWLISVTGLDPIMCMLLGLPVAFGVGFFLQRYLLNFSARISEDTVLVVTFGISVILQNLMQLKWGPLSRNLVQEYSLITWELGPVYIPLNYLLDFAVALLVMAILHLFLKRTFIGKGIRASAQDVTASKLMGIDVEKMYSLTFGISCALCLIAGTFLGMTFAFTPFTGPSLLIIAFGIVVLGGMGSIVGTLVGGIIFGVVQTLSGYFLGLTAQMLLAFATVFLVLSILPRGIFGK